MAGLGRRTHYRKHLTDSVLNDLPEITRNNQRIAKVVGTRGSNQFELIVSPPIILASSSSEAVDSDVTTEKEELNMTPQLAILPTKYRKLIWLKRNDFVICECAEEEESTSTSNDKYDNDGTITNNTNSNMNTIEGGIRFMITHILYKDQIKHLKEKEMWPFQHSIFEDKKEKERDALVMDTTGIIEDQEGNDKCDHDDVVEDCDGYKDDDGIVYTNDDEYLVNMNRIANLKIQDSSSEEEDSD
mmetsp:Transcript_3569/g.4722  ORF Transcript_3569/g.4722 Transcript_3569/m.4722 type:complete len:244 (+) Transcript_3569:116-847(+)